MTMANLTAMEVDALNDFECGLNLTDGHARLPPTATQSDIVQQLPEMFQAANRLPFSVIEQEAHRVFLSTIGQESAPVGTGRILSCYSSTLATDIVARALPSGSTIAVLHPTFDNIADLLRTRGLSLVPLSEPALARQEWPGREVQTIFVTHPNNPTGVVVTQRQLRSLACHAADHGQIVVIDASFRGQVPDAQYDAYAVLDEAAVEWIVIEDTGKLWPTHELKLGLLAFSARNRLPIERAYSESLLSVSPVVLQLITAMARDWANGGRDRASNLVETNRSIVRSALAPVGLELADPSSRISVARVALPPDGPEAGTLYERLLSENVHVLPCGPFHWAEPSSGRYFIRISLSRPADVVRTATEALTHTYRDLIQQLPAGQVLRAATPMDARR